MRSSSLLPGALVLGTLWLAACGNDTPTEATRTAQPAPAGPENALAGSWITRANMPASRTELAAATVTNLAGQSIVYAIGGYNSSSTHAEQGHGVQCGHQYLDLPAAITHDTGRLQRCRRNQW